MNTLPETEVALEAALGTGLPVWVAFVLGPEGDLLGGGDLARAAARVRERGARAVLVSNVPPVDVPAALRKIGGSGPVGALPHLGKYDPPSWKLEFFPRFAETDAWPPDRLVAASEEWRALGARIVGADSGGGPEHTRALVAARGAVA